MYDLTAADVHAMMLVSAAQSRQMGAERRFLLESLVMGYQMRVGHRRFPSIGGRVRVDRSTGRRVLRDRQAVGDRTKETSGEQYGREDGEHAKRIHKRFLESRSMS